MIQAFSSYVHGNAQGSSTRFKFLTRAYPLKRTAMWGNLTVAMGSNGTAQNTATPFVEDREWNSYCGASRVGSAEVSIDGPYQMAATVLA